MDIKELENELIVPLKKMGFRKKRLTWIKQEEQISIVFNIQRSQYSPDIWYYNYGVAVNKLHNGVRGITQCDVLQRFDQYFRGKKLSSHDVITILEMWINKYGTIYKLHCSAIEGRLPEFVTSAARRYLTTVYFDSI